MSEETKVSREETVKAKFAEIQKLMFSSGFTVGEIAQILTAVQNTLNGLTINMNPVAPVEPATEEKVEEVKE